MNLSLAESHAVNELAAILYDFLPASGNNNTSVPIAAQRAGVSDCWSLAGSKQPAIVQLISLTLERRRSRFCTLVVEIVRQAMTWRNRRNEPLTREEIDRLNEIVLQLGFKIPDLHDQRFLDGLLTATVVENGPDGKVPTDFVPTSEITAALASELVRISDYEAQQRGYAFEKFLNNLFGAYELDPREPFKNRGEQIDGSFVHRHEVFLLEAKWQSAEVANRDLQHFSAKVETKSTWGRGLFMSYSGFTDDGLFAFRQGKPTSIICMNGHDLSELLRSGLSLKDVLDRKSRRAVETGHAFVSVRDLYHIV